MTRFAFIGGTSRGFALLESLLKKDLVPVFAIVSGEDSHEPEKYSDNISMLLKEFNVPFEVRKKLNRDDYKKLQDSDLDFAIVYGWRTLIDTTACNTIKTGVIAAHHSLLPGYRGFAPLQWAVINGEAETGVTLFRISDGEIDSGDIISQKKIQIINDEYANEIDKRLVQCSVELFHQFFEDHKNDSIKFTKQNEADATYTCKRIPEDGKIDWNRSSTDIYNLIRALAHPFPGAFCYFGGERYHIKRAARGLNNQKKFSGRIPGRVIRISPEGIEVMCGEGTILISEWENKLTGAVNTPPEVVRSLGDTLK